MQLTGFNTFIGIHLVLLNVLMFPLNVCDSLTLVVLAVGSKDGLYSFHRNTKRNANEEFYIYIYNKREIFFFFFVNYKREIFK
jgi:hypothetical protein